MVEVSHGWERKKAEGEAKKAGNTGLAAPVFSNELGGEDESRGADGGPAKTGEEFKGGVDPNVGGEGREKRREGH